MNMIWNAFAKKLFGTKYEKLIRTLMICLIVFLGLRNAGFQIQISPFIIYLMTTTFTAGVMWQALSSADNAAAMQHMLMLPFQRQEFVFSYTAALGAYTILTKTATLLAIVFAVSIRTPAEFLGSILCAVHAALIAAVLFSLKKCRYLAILWLAAVIAAALFLWNTQWFLPALSADSAFALLLLRNADGYSFYRPNGTNSLAVTSHRRCIIWHYLFRYLNAHKNYWMNTAVLWCVACVLPQFFKQTEGLFILPIGFAILCLNTPICILLSCDPALEQAVRFLPDQKKSFCMPYCLFIFVCNMTADVIFLCSWQIQIGGITVLVILIAIFFALLSAVCSVLLEWFYPIRNWSIESDLWHHPRKYLVPAAMLLLAGIVGAII